MRAGIAVFLVMAVVLQAAMADTLDRTSLSDIQPCIGECPGRGMTMETVGNRFGEPQRRTSAVGEPPITRWIYNDFIVYFERGRVIHVTEPAQR